MKLGAVDFTFSSGHKETRRPFELTTPLLSHFDRMMTKRSRMLLHIIQDTISQQCLV